MAIHYKTLFEIKLMHEYFLTRADGTVIFEHAGQSDRINFLQKEFVEGRSSVSNDVVFEFPENLKVKYQGLNLKLLPTYSGCRVAVRVIEHKLADQSTVYKPLVTLPTGLKIFILIKRKNNNIDHYSNTRIKRPLNAIYYFSNENLLTARTFPFLTNNILPENSSFEYEQGELALSPSNVIREFFRQSGTDQWNVVTGTGFVNESDRLLLSEKFVYTYDRTQTVTKADFLLKDSNNNEVTSLSFEKVSGIESASMLDFSNKIKPVSVDDEGSLLSSVYTLAVRVNNGPAKDYAAVFSNELSGSNPWAVIDIRTASHNNLFNLFAPDGFLMKRKDPLGISTPAPVFEIPVKSRLAYWRFINNRGKELNVAAILTDYLNKEGKVLVTKKPRSLASHWFSLRHDTPPDTIYVPNPVTTELHIEKDRRMFYNIRVPQSELFPIV